VIIAETNRLRLRQSTPEDAQFAYDLNADPEVIRYTGDPPFESVESARTFLRGYNHYEIYGMGRWYCELKDSGKLIGWCGLKDVRAEEGFVDLGYRFLKDYWGHGYATESAFASMVYGFNRLKLDEIIARAMLENIGSLAVMKKLKMNYWKFDECAEHPADYYRLRREEFESIWPKHQWPYSVRIY
jgi:RimJ/RimL family protein N-acetyltransferase